jgi:hypothetical protein
MKKILFSLLFIAQPALTATTDEALTECRQIGADAERVVCYDEFVDSHFPTDTDTDSSDRVDISTAPEVTTALEITTAPEVTTALEVTELSAVPDAQSLFGTADAEAKRLVETSMDIEQISEIEAIVMDVREAANKKLIVTLENGQIWRQLDYQALRLKSGETVIIRKATLGSYLMEKLSGSRSIRVKRAN